MDLIDIGVNLTHDSFDTDRAEVLARADAAGVETMLITGSSIDVSRAAVELARTRPGRLYATAGIHPHHATEYDPEAGAALRELLKLPETVAVGECGLDFFRNFSPPAAQQAAFQAQLELACELALPVFLHQRDAHEQFLATLRLFRDDLVGGVAHCFTGDRRALQAYLEFGLYIGITGWICDERRGGELQALVGEIPLERLLIETDAPYLLPRDLQPRPSGRRNEPAFLPHVLQALARHAGRDVCELARATTRNARRLFGLAGDNQS